MSFRKIRQHWRALSSPRSPHPVWSENSEPHPVDGTRCWIYLRKRVKLARADSGCAGGWMNSDTWEDFRGDVTHFMVASVPSPPLPEDTT